VVATPAEVREKFRRVKPFGEIKGSARVSRADAGVAPESS
jgi:hypothetical protein